MLNGGGTKVKPAKRRTSLATLDSDGASTDQGIKVLCRFRKPIYAIKSGGDGTLDGLDGELSKGLITVNECYSIDTATSNAVTVNLEDTDVRSFAFDKMLSPFASQAQVFSEVESIIDAVVAGFNGTILAYGQTSAGKSYTMEGPSLFDSNRGITSRSIDKLFSILEKLESNRGFDVTASYMEIYCEKVRDLLNPSSDNLKMREKPAVNGSSAVIVQDLTECICVTKESLYKLIEKGKTNRMIAPTLINAESSRSHSILTINLSIKGGTKGSVNGKLFLVDLAGSEKVSKTGASGIRLDEAKNINSSLTTLSMVINALCDNSTGQGNNSHMSHIPYRDSKLTYFLRDALGGNSKTVLILCCAPEKSHVPETVSTLRFGERAKRIKNKARVNEEMSVEELKAMLSRMKDENKNLKLEISKLEANAISRSFQGGVLESSVSKNDGDTQESEEQDEVLLTNSEDIRNNIQIRSDEDFDTRKSEGEEIDNNDDSNAQINPKRIAKYVNKKIKDTDKNKDDDEIPVRTESATFDMDHVYDVSEEFDHDENTINNLVLGSISKQYNSAFSSIDNNIHSSNTNSKTLSSVDVFVKLDQKGLESAPNRGIVSGSKLHNENEKQISSSGRSCCSCNNSNSNNNSYIDDTHQASTQDRHSIEVKGLRRHIDLLIEEVSRLRGLVGMKDDELEEGKTRVNHERNKTLELNIENDVLRGTVKDMEEKVLYYRGLSQTPGRSNSKSERTNSVEFLQSINDTLSTLNESYNSINIPDSEFVIKLKQEYNQNIIRLTERLNAEQQARTKMVERLEEADSHISNLRSRLQSAEDNVLVQQASYSSSSISWFQYVGRKIENAGSKSSSARGTYVSPREELLAKSLAESQTRCIELESEISSMKEANMIVLETKDSVLRNFIRQNSVISLELDEHKAKSDTLQSQIKQLTGLLRDISFSNSNEKA